MKSEITISELARLMRVSVHQIRYFEEKGILQPAYVDSNQYRMYGMDQVYRLAHILLLRKLGLSVQAIGGSIDSCSPDQLQLELRHSLNELDTEIARLQELRQFTVKMLQGHQQLGMLSGSYRLVQRAPANLTRWAELNSSMQLTARQLADRAKPVPDLFESDIHYVAAGPDSFAVCLETDASGDLVLPEGEYLTALQWIGEEDELQQAIEDFYEYAARQSLTLDGPLILIERSYLSLFSGSKLHYELLAKVQPAQPGGRA